MERLIALGAALLIAIWRDRAYVNNLVNVGTQDDGIADQVIARLDQHTPIVCQDRTVGPVLVGVIKYARVFSERRCTG